MRDKMRMSSVGLEILKERPRITPETMDLGYLGGLPEDTFGYAYYRLVH